MREGDGTSSGTFTDKAWAIWEPLIEAVRPRGKTPSHDPRRTIAVIFWRHENGAKWRSIPAELGPWWRAAQFFIRRSLLIAARRGKGLTQATLAERLGKPQSYVAKYETGERRIDVIEFLDITTAIGLDAADILASLLEDH
ncbi:transposase [Novacetimonas hansenii]|uniref:HTH cro/C1-type domain-containing protein n=1 Tax=Novacetimonas hansenii TaxID=436 RepID=A0ABQ0SJ02_NOVHA|nr:transcriptional regulator [Novacetimonas hansenii JCM 7643]GBQ54136.1 transposase [Novacetimonas hansenii NRIC 0243]GEC65256.1 hypothetical protein GHA01_31050 [Novacetimonas hansenii]CUW47963.1 Helix-turn-helix [Novacetimonas hansenii]